MNSRIIPHPVLYASSIDYRDGLTFDMDVGDAMYTIEGNITLSVKFTLHSRFMNQLIRDKMAKIILRTRCSKTHQRDMFEVGGLEYELNLPSSNYVDKIKIDSYITTNDTIKSFRSKEHHPEFQGVTITVPEGGILAHGSGGEILIDLLPTISSAIDIQLNPDLDDGQYRFDLGSDKIIIYLNTTTMQKIEMLRKSNPNVLFPSLYMSALTHAIQNIEEGRERKWEEALKKTLTGQQIKINQEDLQSKAYEYAQTLLENPIQNIMEGMNHE